MDTLQLALFPMPLSLDSLTTPQGFNRGRGGGGAEGGNSPMTPYLYATVYTRTLKIAHSSYRDLIHVDISYPVIAIAKLPMIS